MKKILFVFSFVLIQYVLNASTNRTVAILDLTARNAEANDGELYSTKHVLKVAGLPFVVTTDVNVAKQYGVIIASSKVTSSTFLIAEKDTLIAYVNRGGTLVVPNLTDTYFYNLFGVSAYSQLDTLHRITFDVSLSDPTMRWLNDTLEQTISIGKWATDTTYAARSYTTTTSTVLAHYNNGTNAIVKNIHGLGHTYLMGYSFRYMILFPQLNKDVEAQRTYSNGFEPTSDVWILFMKGICITQISNSVWLHTSPYESKATFIITHDVDAKTSYDTMRYYADYEHSLGISATYFCTTHYLRDTMMTNYYNPSKIQYILSKGQKVGSHSVGHFWDFDVTATFPYGSFGNDTSNYRPYCGGVGVSTIGGTVLGETEVSRNLLQNDVGINCRSFRAGFLCYPKKLVNALDTLNYLFNSTYSANDVLTNFPYLNHKDRTSTGLISRVWEIPMTISDDFLSSTPFSPSNYAQKEAIWFDVLKRNAANYAPTVLLIHPTRMYKMLAEQMMIDSLPAGIAIYDLETYGDYWIARNAVDFSSVLSNDSLTITIPQTLLPLDDKISFVVDSGQSLQNIKAQDDFGNPIIVIQSNWDNNGVILHFGGMPHVGIHSVDAQQAFSVNIFPNPFSNSSTIEVSQKETGLLNITIYNMYGQLVKTIVNEKRNAGVYHEVIDAVGISAGTYFCKITSGNSSIVKRIVITQ